jgi:hypothetical protein
LFEALHSQADFRLDFSLSFHLELASQDRILRENEISTNHYRRTGCFGQRSRISYVTCGAANRQASGMVSGQAMRMIDSDRRPEFSAPIEVG